MITTGKFVDRLADVVTDQSTRPKTGPSRPLRATTIPTKKFGGGEACQLIYDAVTDLA